MVLPNSGPMTAAMINQELERSPTAYFNLNGFYERQLADKPTGSISFNDFYGKSRTFDITSTLNGNYNRFDLATHFENMGWDGVKPLSGTITFNGTLFSDSTSEYALTIRNLSSGSDITVRFFDYVVGLGGNGGSASYTANEGGSSSNTNPGQPGGDAIYVYTSSNAAVTIENYGLIGGGGDGGGGSVDESFSGVTVKGGGGGAGGYGSTVSQGGSASCNSSGGATCLPTEQGEDGTKTQGGGPNGGGLGDGNSIVGRNRVTLINNGTILGPFVNTDVDDPIRQYGG